MSKPFKKFRLALPSALCGLPWRSRGAVGPCLLALRRSAAHSRHTCVGAAGGPAVHVLQRPLSEGRVQRWGAHDRSIMQASQGRARGRSLAGRWGGLSSTQQRQARTFLPPLARRGRRSKLLLLRRALLAPPAVAPQLGGVLVARGRAPPTPRPPLLQQADARHDVRTRTIRDRIAPQDGPHAFKGRVVRRIGHRKGGGAVSGGRRRAHAARRAQLRGDRPVCHVYYCGAGWAAPLPRPPAPPLGVRRRGGRRLSPFPFGAFARP